MIDFINYIFDFINHNIYLKVIGIISFLMSIKYIVEFLIKFISKKTITLILNNLCEKKCYFKSNSGTIEISYCSDGHMFRLVYNDDGKLIDTSKFLDNSKIKIGLLDSLRILYLYIFKYEKIISQSIKKSDVHCHHCTNGFEDYYITSKSDIKIIKYNIEIR